MFCLPKTAWPPTCKFSMERGIRPGELPPHPHITLWALCCMAWEKELSMFGLAAVH